MVLGIVGAEAVRADQFGKPVRLMRRRHLPRPAHFRQPHLHARLGELPSRFRAREAAAYDVNLMSHDPGPDTRSSRAKSRGVCDDSVPAPLDFARYERILRAPLVLASAFHRPVSGAPTDE